MKNILIPTDFSKNSFNAIEYAMSFFKDIEINFHFLHVSLMEEIDAEQYFYAISESSSEERVTKNPIERLKGEIQKAKDLSENKNHKFDYIHEYVQFVEAVRQHIAEKEIDLVIMGTKGASKNNIALLGSNTADVITRVKCPVLVIPERARYTDPKNIVFPTDFNMFYKEKVLHTLSEILQIKNGTLKVLYVSKKINDLSDTQKKNRNYLEDYLEEKPHSFYFISEGTIDTAITKFSEKNQVDMIAMIAKNLNFFQRLLFIPTIEKVSYHTKIPFLVLHE